MTALEIWVDLVRLLQDGIKNCKVYRCYDVSTVFADVAKDDKPRLYVQLDGVTEKPTGFGESRKKLELKVDLSIYAIWKGRSNNADEYDELLPLLERILGVLSFWKINRSGDTYSLVNPEFGTSDELFDREVLTDNGIFLSTVSVTAIAQRMITNGDQGC